MFARVTAHQGAPRVDSYAAAEAALAKYKALEATKRRRKPMPVGTYPLGGHAKSVTWVRQEDGGEIAFQLYDTDVVTWRPDNSVVIDNYGTVTTTGFASRFLPRGISLNFPTSVRGREGGNKGIEFSADMGNRWGSRHICQGGLARFIEQDGAWVPDETTLDPINLLDIDRKMAREATAGLPWKDFEMWLSMAPMHLDLDHEVFDLEHCLTGLRKRDFRFAAVHLPTVTIPNGWGAADRIKPLPIAVRDSNKPITMGSLNKLKLAIWEDAGAIGTTQHMTVPCAEYKRRMARARELQNLGLDYWHVGAYS